MWIEVIIGEERSRGIICIPHTFFCIAAATITAAATVFGAAPAKSPAHAPSYRSSDLPRGADYFELRDGLAVFFGERRFGGAGDRVVVEACLEGEEVSLIALSDGKRLLPLDMTMLLLVDRDVS